MLDDVYPAGPARVPADLTAPSPSYKRQAWIAMAVLMSFALLYMFFVGWFGYTTYRLGTQIAHGRFDIGPIAGCVLSAFLLLLLSRALFAVKRGQGDHGLEVTAAEQPVLFAFLHRLADEAGAPRPHRVFLSGEVNAAVFYDVSFKNLLVPSKKNLEIGLGLVNALTLGEFKAVLAHEFGHFAQRSMAVGRWVYTAQQIASHLVHTRGIFDRFLRGLSRFDVRIAWVGWLMRLIVWSLRSLLDTAFALVVMAQRALSREMELQADLVSVSLSGSDAIVHALHRLNAADQAYSGAVSFALGELRDGHRVSDVFAVQTRMAEHLRRVFDDREFGNPPALPSADPAAHRVFESAIATPPKMWLTHPPGREREENAKRQYVAAQLDDRSAWSLFADPQALREKVTGQILSEVKLEADPAASQISESLGKLDIEFSRQGLDPRYRGMYMGRSSVRDVNHAKEMLPEEPTTGPGDMREALAALYPETLSSDLRHWRELEEELETLQALQQGNLMPADGVIRHRGAAISKRNLPGVIAELEREEKAARARLLSHDRLCRSTHLSVALHFGRGWPEQLRGLLDLLHYAEHSEANLLDAGGHYDNVFSWVTADGSVSGREMKRLIKAGLEVHGALGEVFEHRSAVLLPKEVRERMECESWSDALPTEFGLPTPTTDSIGVFVEHVHDWLGATIGPMRALKRATLDTLLETEARLATCLVEGADPGQASDPATVPGKYTVVPTGKQRAREKSLHWWDRFQLGDGLFGSVARFAVAGGVMAGVLGMSRGAGDATLLVHNGLNLSVQVKLGEQLITVAPQAHGELEMPLEAALTLEARSADGELIESLPVREKEGAGKYFYNVAGAAPLIEWTAMYGSGASNPERLLGNATWGETSASVTFEEPPTKSKSTRLTVLTALTGEPQDLLERVSEAPAQARMVEAHIAWDPLDSPHFAAWLNEAERARRGREIVLARLAKAPHDMLLSRAAQDLTSGDEQAALCAERKQAASADPADANALYLSIRCEPDGPARDQAFFDGYTKHKDNAWLAWAAGASLESQGRWEEAYQALRTGIQGIPAFRASHGMEFARLARVSGHADDVPALEADSLKLHEVLQLERGAADLGQLELRAYAQLARGELAQALQTASGNQHTRARMTRLVAASSGATPEQVQAALALAHDEGIDGSTIFSALALAKYHKQKASEYEATFAQMLGELAPVMLKLADPAASFGAADAARTRASVEETLSQLPIFLRGQGLVMASIGLNFRVPEKWIAEANAILFAPERPHLAAVHPPQQQADGRTR